MGLATRCTCSIRVCVNPTRQKINDNHYSIVRHTGCLSGCVCGIISHCTETIVWDKFIVHTCVQPLSQFTVGGLPNYSKRRLNPSFPIATCIFIDSACKIFTYVLYTNGQFLWSHRFSEPVDTCILIVPHHRQCKVLLD